MESSPVAHLCECRSLASHWLVAQVSLLLIGSSGQVFLSSMREFSNVALLALITSNNNNLATIKFYYFA